jgi:hypothetical protein
MKITEVNRFKNNTRLVGQQHCSPMAEAFFEAFFALK